MKASKIEEVIEKTADAICPHHFDKSQKEDIKNALTEFVKAIIIEVREDYRKNFWP